MFVVTTQLVGETFTVEEFEGMVADGAVRLVFLAANDAASKGVFDSAISEGGYVVAQGSLFTPLRARSLSLSLCPSLCRTRTRTLSRSLSLYWL